jgi:Putative DNA-binding domain
MPTLRETQDLFRAALLGEPSPALVDLVECDGLDPRGRLAVYRHHVFTTLTATLEAAFPVVCRLVDRRFFAYVADAFVRQHPPGGPCLDEYGSAFPEFLAAFEACKGLPYLPDVARLEWAIHLAGQAPDVAPLDRALLGSLAPADMARLQFMPRTGLTYLVSPWPVDRIWRAHQGESEAMPDLGAGRAWLEISPSQESVILRSLDPSILSFRKALAGGLTLGEAAEKIAHQDPDLDLPGSIRSFLDDRVFSSFTLAAEEGA